MTEKVKVKILGIILLVIGVTCVCWSWYTAVNYGYFYEKFSLIFPAIAAIGLGVTFFGTGSNTRYINSKKELEKFLAENEISEVRMVNETKNRTLPKPLWIMIGVGMFLSVLNYFALSSYLNLELSRTLFMAAMVVVATAVVIYIKFRP